jgi:hypothetical protein
MNEIEPPASGWPSKVTVPDTSSRGKSSPLAEHPATNPSAAHRTNARRNRPLKHAIIFSSLDFQERENGASASRKTACGETSITHQGDDRPECPISANNQEEKRGIVDRVAGEPGFTRS